MVQRSYDGVLYDVISPCAFKTAGFPVYVAGDEKGWFVVSADPEYRFGSPVESRAAGFRLIAQGLMQYGQK